MRLVELYGQERSQEWLRAEYERDKASGLVPSGESEEGPFPQHWSVGWDCRRDGYWDGCDDWRPANSWTCSKIVVPSYADDLCVRLYLRVSGRRDKRGKLRAKRWAAAVGLGLPRRRVQLIVMGHFLAPSKSSLPIGYCSSLTDAMKRADKLDLTEAIAKALAGIYQSDKASCYWRLGDDGTYQPYMTTFEQTFGRQDLPFGRYAVARRLASGQASCTFVDRARGMTTQWQDDAELELCMWLPENDE